MGGSQSNRYQVSEETKKMNEKKNNIKNDKNGKENYQG